MSRKRPRTLELLDEIENCEGMRRHWKAKMWGYTFYTYSKNALELRDCLRQYEDPRQAIFRAIQTQDPGDEQFRANMVRHLHNFLAAAKSLVEHSRNFMKGVYAGHPLLAEYEDRVRSEMATSGLVQFVHDLRNYMLHKGIPIVRETLEFHPGGQPAFAVALNLAGMRSWSGWSSGSRVFMQTLPDHIRLADVIEPYLEKTVHFYQWLTNRRLVEDKPVMEELRELQRQLSEAQQKSA
jgi:hypothetical protein